MALRFFKKTFPKCKAYTILSNVEQETIPVDKIESMEEIEDNKKETVVAEEETTTKKNKKTKKIETMNLGDKIRQAEDTLVAMEPAVKVVKSDKGLIERTESSKIILTEDNRQLLID